MELSVIKSIASLFNSESNKRQPELIGTTTVGSSEAIFLAMTNYKKNWLKKAHSGKPNFIIGAGYHAIWEKVSKFLEIEMIVVPFSTNSYNLSEKDIEKFIDHGIINANTIAICLML